MRSIHAAVNIIVKASDSELSFHNLVGVAGFEPTRTKAPGLQSGGDTSFPITPKSSTYDNCTAIYS